MKQKTQNKYIDLLNIPSFKIGIKSILIAIIIFVSLPFTITAQTLQLGTLSSFEAFAGVGAVTNNGTATGDAGTNDGIISGSGFGTGYSGTTHNNNALTVQARIDLLKVYIHLDDIFVTYPSTHAPAFGGGETITPGVYSIGGAGSIGGTLTLDGGGDSNAFFIIKFEGAFTVGANSKIILSNGTRAANVFWISQGAIAVATDCVIKGTLFAHPGAVTLGVDSTIDGRLLTSEGAITIAAGGKADLPTGPIAILIKCLGNCASSSALGDVLGSVGNFGLFTSLGAVANAATSGIVGDIGTNGGAISGFGTSTHVGSFYKENAVTVKAKEDLDKAYTTLMGLANTVTDHGAAFGSGETIAPGIYAIAGAGSLAGTLTLDGGGDSNAVFVFKFAGAFSVAAQSRVILTNGARRCNVFWIGGAGVATGAVSMGTFTYMKGTVISHGGACTMGANGSMEGRMLSTGGAIGFSTGVLYNDTLCFNTPDPTPSPVAAPITPTVITPPVITPPVITPPVITPPVITPPVIKVPVPGIIKAVTDTTVAVNGKTGGTTTSLTSNDTLNGSPVIIGTGTGNVTLQGVNVPRWFTLNPDGTVTIAPNTPAVEFNLEYKICEVGFSSNCSSVVSTILVTSTSPDFTPTIEINSLVFATEGSTQDFVINISEIWGAPSEGQVVVNLQKVSAFKISYDPTASTSNVNGGISVHNNKWEITENPFWITMKLKESVVIKANAFSTIGFTITRKPNVPNKTMQPITASIVAKSGSDGNGLNNTSSIIVEAKQ
jgi:hypothetical protein